jgi:hypothetical protein
MWILGLHANGREIVLVLAVYLQVMMTIPSVELRLRKIILEEEDGAKLEKTCVMQRESGAER